jgi:outer membrane protein
MNVKRVAFAAAALLLFPTARVFAQAGGAAAPAPTKIGVMDVRQAIVGSAEGKQASAELQSQFAPRNNELDTLRKQIEDLQNRLRTGDRTLSDDEKGRLQRQGETLSRIYQRRQTDLQEDLQSAENEVIDRIGRKMREIVDRHARENGFILIVDVSSAQSNIVYASNGIDITQDIIKLYDQAFPVRGAAAPATQPGTPRPQPTAPKPPAQKPPQR